MSIKTHINLKLISPKLLSSLYRKEMWRNTARIVQKLDKTIPIKHAYVMGSFTTRKKRPGDVDFIILLQVPEKNKDSKWCVDLVIAPANKYGRFILKDEDLWVKSRYGLKKSTLIKIK